MLVAGMAPEPRRWGLRTRLLAPIVILVLISVATLGLTSDLSTRAITELLISQRASSVLEGIAERLNERERLQSLLAQLLAEERELPRLLENGEQSDLPEALASTQTKLGLSRIAVLAADGREVLNVGSREGAAELAPLVTAGLSGSSESRMAIDGDGLLVSAVAPVVGSRGIAGVVIVSASLGAGTLKDIRDREAVELGIFGGTRLVATTVDDPELLKLLSDPGLLGDKQRQPNRSLARFNYQAAGRPIGADGLLVALVPTRDLELLSEQRNLWMLLTIAALVLALLLIGLLQARDISNPVGSMVHATRDLVQGNYRRRVPSSTIRELDNLGGAVNNLAEQLEVQLLELSHRAFYDSLSHLPNRALFMDRLTHAVSRASRRAKWVAVVYMDLDNFKVINDSLGHQVGDELLVAVADRLRTSLRPEDTVARLGGDEFTVLLEDVEDVGDAVRLARRVLGALRAPFEVGGHQVFTSASLGIAMSTPDGDEPAALLRDADLAMYRAKTTGKGRFEIFDPSLKHQAIERLRLETDLRQAVESQQFELHYQPIVSIDTGRILEVEALVRWRHPERGLVSPAQFISIAEETGLIMPLGRWVLQEACRQARAWQSCVSSELPLVMSVNLSPAQFQHPDLVAIVAETLQSTGLPPGCLKLEITESVMMQAADLTVRTLRELKALGVRLAIDDFGTGYSSLAYLRSFPIDTLKIDRSFVTRLGDNAEDAAIVRIIMMLAKTLGMSVTAEGIETAEQLAYLRAEGCDRGQGYLFARPLPAEQLARRLSVESGRAAPAEPASLFHARFELLARLRPRPTANGQPSTR